ncbi:MULTISPECIES: hypothetical protein [Actinopolyspora]|uniref:Uncharacterized protein n=1 Tax=Actinopolyspora saharensis TaxID=995062 RepID=A0A1H1G1Z4_9ACTN|nr:MULTISPECIES: hypothetical protein [Actinopolyspora]NHD16300.1 hypothetical protein [Actinopolyspora sp. BKK2]NHE75837.1 hypothetical protein [Actinopolyspora sp. BKK1]SDR07105.1 hypothetical protein SAMN04489718_3368 [Actinopolyspora saharensis]
MSSRADRQARFVLGWDSGWIHATSSHLAADFRHGWVLCLCGAWIALAPHPPVLLDFSWHGYCGPCLMTRAGIADLRNDLREPYPSWLVTS